MATHSTLASLFTAIADKIRTKTGSTAAIVADDFPDAIDNILTPADGTIATKTSSDLTTSGATVTVPAGYYASNASKSVATVTQATPSISVNSSGLITASSTQSAGYVTAGTKKATKQLTTQAAKTVTPSTSSKTAVSSGVYTTGAVTVKGDSNLKAENIKSGVSIFGVDGAFSGGNFDLVSLKLSDRTQFEVKCDFEPKGIYVAQSNEASSNLTASSRNEIFSIFWHKDATYCVDSTASTVSERASINSYSQSEFADYYQIETSSKSIYVESLDEDFTFDGTYYAFIF